MPERWVSLCNSGVSGMFPNKCQAIILLNNDGGKSRAYADRMSVSTSAWIPLLLQCLLKLRIRKRHTINEIMVD